MDIRIIAKPFQEKFLLSNKRYPALVAGIGTGKTYMLLLKIWKFCQDYPNSLALIVRKEFTDLHDSTMKDFKNYFNVNVNAEKEFVFSNDSVIMFRHAAEMEVLKNINLSIFGIEQAEEFETDEQFIFLRDRLRRTNSPLRQGCVIANANGHNWIWRFWLNNPTSDDFDLSCATTFDNADNLPADFIADLRRMEIDAPNHYKQYVINSFEELDSDDLLLTGDMVYNSPKFILREEGTHRLILACDVARFGEDETVFTLIKSQNIMQWEQIFQETRKGWDLMRTTGYILELKRQFRPDVIVIDDVGIGGGVTDRLREQRTPPIAFIANEKPANDLYDNKRAEGYFMLKDLFLKGYLKIINDTELMEQLLSIKFKYKSNGKKAIVSKDEMRKDGLKSPDRADALMMAISQTKNIFNRTLHPLTNLPREAETEAVLF
jgi:phage terminase large subunit